MDGAIPKRDYGTPRRRKRMRASEVADANLARCFIAIHPNSPELCSRMLTFLKEHYRDWRALTGERREASPPRKGKYRAPQKKVNTIEFHYSTNISDLESQYIASLARWTALRIGHVRRRTVGKASETAGLQGCKNNPTKYEAPCVFYNGHEKWLVVREGSWKHDRPPDKMGVGTLCDEHGFQSQDIRRERQTRYYVENLNGEMLPHVRKLREKEQRIETLIHDELRRLSSLWST